MDASSPRLVVILSAPRSGSTLLQRALAVAPGVATSSESWLLPGLVTAVGLTDLRQVSEWGTSSGRLAIEDLGAYGYTREAKRDSVRAAYNVAVRSMAPHARCFVEKAPRNCLLLPELFDVLPDALFVAIRRHPFAVARSILRSIPSRRGTIERYYVDLLEGLPRLAASLVRPREAMISVAFEELVTKTPYVVGQIFDRFGLSAEGQHGLAPRPAGRMGDPGPGSLAATVNTEYDRSWKDPSDGLRHGLLFRRILQRLGQEGMVALGFSHDEASKYADALVRRGRWDVRARAVDGYERLWNRLSLAAQKEILACGPDAVGLS